MNPGLLVVVNGAAGSADDEPVEAALAVLRGGADVEVAATSSSDELDDVVRSLDGRRPVVMGGDGSLHAVAAALDRAGVLGAQPVGLIACGTGNDLARTLGLPLDPEDGARVVLERIQQVPGIVATNTLVAVPALPSDDDDRDAFSAWS
jgi:diacylglycerol kinase family enzyme